MEKYVLILLLICLNQIVFSQSRGVVTSNEITHPITIRTFDLAESTLIHQHFYNTAWMDAKIFKNELSKGFPAMIKYDILNQQVNFLSHNRAMVASSRKISSFTIPQLGKKFIGLAPKNWKRGIVFFEALLEGKYTLLLFHEGIKQKPDYDPILNVGSKSEKIIEKQTYCLLKDGEVFKIPSRKKAGIKFFSTYKKATAYLKEHKVNFKEQADLIGLFRFMNERG
ncbi:MAG: hypothetical protein AB8G86_16450 [Saprospiraceae bacterium]